MFLKLFPFNAYSSPMKIGILLTLILNFSLAQAVDRDTIIKLYTQAIESSESIEASFLAIDELNEALTDLKEQNTYGFKQEHISILKEAVDTHEKFTKYN